MQPSEPIGERLRAWADRTRTVDLTSRDDAGSQAWLKQLVGVWSVSAVENRVSERVRGFGRHRRL